MTLQACQGSKVDHGVAVKASHGRTSTDSFASYRTPLHADFLLAHSTVAGYYSWRNTVQGSWFIQVSKTRAHTQTHLPVTRYLALPCWLTMLTRTCWPYSLRWPRWLLLSMSQTLPGLSSTTRSKYLSSTPPSLTSCLFNQSDFHCISSIFYTLCTSILKE